MPFGDFIHRFILIYRHLAIYLQNQNENIVRNKTQSTFHKVRNYILKVNNMARILVERGSVKKLARFFEVSEQTVRNALRYITEGEMPERIREKALSSGGVKTRKGFNL